MQLRLSFSIADTLLWLDILISALSTMSWLSCNWYCICYLTFPFLVLSIQLDFHISGIVTTYWPSYFWSCHLQLDFHISDNVTTTWQSFYWYCHLLYDLSTLFLALSATTWLFHFWYFHLWLNSPFSCLVLFFLANYDCPIFGLYQLGIQLDFLVPCTCALGLHTLSS